MPRVTGPLTTTDVTDVYPTHDALLGLGGLREVADHTERNAIPDERRREGMIAYTANDNKYWLLGASPWLGSDADWVEASITAASTLDPTLTALGGVATGPDLVPYFTGTDTAATTALSSFARDLIADATATSARLTLAASSKASIIVGPTGDSGYITDGVADNVQVQAAVDDASASVVAGIAVVEVQPGVLLSYSAPVVPKSNVIVRGFAAIIHDGTDNGYTGIGLHSAFRDDGVNEFTNFGLADLTIVGDTTTSSTTCGVYLTGSNDLDNPTAPVLSDVYMHNVKIHDCASLPVRIFGTSGKLSVLNCDFNHNADAGFGFNEELIFMGNHSIDSRDNGFSISRGNTKVVCASNTVENASFWGIWASGYNNQAGPGYMVINANVVKGSGRSSVAIINAPNNLAVVGNVLDQEHNRASDSDVDGIQIRGGSLSDRATNILVSSNIIKNASRNGISYGWVDQLSIVGNQIIDAGTQYKANGTTPILSSDRSTNVGILRYHDSTNVWIDGNNIIDTRAVPFTNVDIYPVVSSTISLGKNNSNGMRVTRNRIDFSSPVEAGSPVGLNVNGPDTNIDFQVNLQGSGEMQVRGTGGLNVHSPASGTGTSPILRFSAGDETKKVGGVSATRTDPATSSLLAFNVLSAGALTASTAAAAPLYIQGRPDATGAWVGYNAGILFKRRAIADALATVVKSDHIIAYTSLTAARTVNLPTAAGGIGRTYIIKDETGSAATYNLTLTPYAFSGTTFTDADVDVTNNLIRLSTLLETGTAISMTTPGTMPGGVTASTTYYVTRNTLVLNNSAANAGTLANDSTAGYVAWSNPSNAAGSDNSYATWASDGNINPSDPRGDAQTFAGSITASDKTLTASSSVFTIADAGKNVRIPGAGAAGADLITTISSFTSDVEVELTAAAGTTVSGVTSAFASGDYVESEYLKVTNFGFAIPSAANVEGIKVEVEGKSTSTTSEAVKVYDIKAQLLKAGVLTGDDKAAITAFTGSDTTKTYGATDDLWGATLSPTDVNGSTFGFIFQVKSVLGVANIDNIRITIYYTIPYDIKLATTQANALAGTAIDITTTGSGTITVASPAQTIDGSSTKVININNGVAQIYSDGSNWQITGGLYNTSQLTTLGGFSNPMTTLGDLMYEDSTPAATRLAGNTTTTKKFLTQTGNGSISAVPSWGTLAAADVPTLNQDTTGKSAKTDALNSATTIVNVSSATAPTAGQVLKATDSTHATWQTLTGVSTGYSMQFGANATTTGASLVFANSQTYYFGNFHSAQPTTTDGNARIYIPTGGHVTAVYLWVHVITNTYTNENVAISLRVNSSDTSITTTGDFSSTNLISNTGLSVAVSAGDYFQIKMVTPAWVTHTGTIRLTGTIFVTE